MMTSRATQKLKANVLELGSFAGADSNDLAYPQTFLVNSLPLNCFVNHSRFSLRQMQNCFCKNLLGSTRFIFEDRSP